MLTEDYVQVVNAQLERLLVYETVFKEYTQTCLNIERGHCYATENLERLRGYFSRNVLRFNRFVENYGKIQAPKEYGDFNALILSGLKGIKHGVSMMLMAIEKDGLNHGLFEAGLAKQKQSRTEIDGAFTHIASQAM